MQKYQTEKIVLNIFFCFRTASLGGRGLFDEMISLSARQKSVYKQDDDFIQRDKSTLCPAHNILHILLTKYFINY